MALPCVKGRIGANNNRWHNLESRLKPFILSCFPISSDYIMFKAFPGR